MACASIDTAIPKCIATPPIMCMLCFAKAFSHGFNDTDLRITSAAYFTQHKHLPRCYRLSIYSENRVALFLPLTAPFHFSLAKLSSVSLMVFILLEVHFKQSYEPLKVQLL